MKIKKIILCFVFVFALSSCSNNKEEYKSKDVKVSTIYDSDFSDHIDIDDELEDDEFYKKLKEDLVKDYDSDVLSDPMEEYNTGDELKEDNLDKNSGYETRNNVNLMKKPSNKESDFVITITKGSRVELIRNKEVDGIKWSEISYKGKKGYLRRDSLKKIN